MKQTMTTVQLAIKFFDFVSIIQIEDPLSKSGRNDPNNLRLLAAQCLLLASKMVETQRIFPAEIVHQVRGWGGREYDALKEGQIEEYILNHIKFDCIFLTPSEFINFMIDSWQITNLKSCDECHPQLMKNL